MSLAWRDAARTRRPYYDGKATDEICCTGCLGHPGDVVLLGDRSAGRRTNSTRRVGYLGREVTTSRSGRQQIC